MSLTVRRVVVACVVVMTLAPSLAVPAETDDRLAEAVSLQEVGNHDEAIAVYRSILDREPGHARALAGLAFSTYAMGDYEATVSLAEQILATGKDSPPGVYLIIGSAYGMLGVWDKAEEVLLLGQSVWPSNDALRFNRAINLFAQEKFAQAIDELELCIRRSPYRPEYWRVLGDALLGDGARGRAFAAYVRAATLESDPEHSREIALTLWSMLFDKPIHPSGAQIDETEQAEEMGLSLVGILRNDERWKGQSDATFFAYAVDTVLRLVAALNAKGEANLFWGPFVLAYFDDLRAAGHMEALAYDIRCAVDDPVARVWGDVHPEKVARYRDWSERWAVNWSRVSSKERSAVR